MSHLGKCIFINLYRGVEHVTLRKIEVVLGTYPPRGRLMKSKTRFSSIWIKQDPWASPEAKTIQNHWFDPFSREFLRKWKKLSVKMRSFTLSAENREASLCRIRCEHP